MSVLDHASTYNNRTLSTWLYQHSQFAGVNNRTSQRHQLAFGTMKHLYQVQQQNIDLETLYLLTLTARLSPCACMHLHVQQTQCNCKHGARSKSQDDRASPWLLHDGNNAIQLGVSVTNSPFTA